MHRLLPLLLLLSSGCALYDIIPMEEEMPSSDMTPTPQPNNMGADPCDMEDSDWVSCGVNGTCFDGECRTTCSSPRDATGCPDEHLCAATFQPYLGGNDLNYGPYLCLPRDALRCDGHQSKGGEDVPPQLVCQQMKGPGTTSNPACLEDPEDGWSCRPSCNTDTDCEDDEECLESAQGSKGCVSRED